MEIWKEIYGGSYQVSSYGRIKSVDKLVNGHLRKGKLLKLSMNDKGYLYANVNGKKARVNRIAACAFIANPDSKPIVNHKDGNKTNNCVSNLEWVTHSENTQHAYDNNLRPKVTKQTRQVTVKYGEKITVFETMQDCATFFGFKKGWLHNRIRKHGLTFNYNGYEIEVSERRRA